MTIKEQIKEFIQALDEEICALKEGKGGNVFKLYNGRFKRESAGLYIYTFRLESPLIVMDDTPGDLEVNSQFYSCQIVMSQGMEVQIAIEKYIGQHVSEAKIQTNLWYLLEMLKKKYEEEHNNTEQNFEMGEKIFCGNFETLDSKGKKPQYDTIGKSPNPSQKNAISFSFEKNPAVIWGPPGTGKTFTIGMAIQAHLKAGRRVLLVSHANTAVDEALENIAKQLKDSTFYNEGKLVRLGTHRKDSLEKYPLVLLDSIVEELGKSLIQEKEDLIKKKEILNKTLNTYKNIQTKIDKYSEINSEIEAIEKTIENLKNENNNNEDILKYDKTLLNKKYYELNRAKNSGRLKRFFLAINPEKIQRKIDNLRINIGIKEKILVEISTKIHEANNAMQIRNNTLKDLSFEINNLLEESKITLDELQHTIETLELEINNMCSRTKEITQLLDDMQERILKEARLIATTLTKTFSSKNFPNTKFDVVIVDEASMAPLPHLYWAISKAFYAVTIVGDFLQLPPICISRKDMAKKWLKRSIFDILGIDIDSVKLDNRVVLLDKQYRMHPKIARIPNDLFYKSLKNDDSVKSLGFNDSISSNEQLNLIDTSDVNPWCSQISTGGRFNIYSALVSVSIAQKILQENTGKSIGIISPYKAQTRLIDKIAKDRSIQENIRVSTIHSFQGGQESVIIVDCVEGPGAKFWSMLNNHDNPDARNLLNVTMTRAKEKIYLITNKDYIFSIYKRRSLLHHIVEKFNELGQVKLSREITSEDSYFTEDFEKWASATSSEIMKHVEQESTSYNEKSFWPKFLKDVQSSQESIIILSPFASLNRIGHLMNYFSVLINRGVDIRIYMKPPYKQGGHLSEHAEQAINLFTKWDISVIQRIKLHQKIAIIDRKISWEGSLNILSHKDTEEHMRRIEGKNVAEEIIRDLDLDEDEAVGNIIDELCPKCLKKGLRNKLVVKRSRYGKFKGCSSYPECKYIDKYLKIKKKKR
ncbi:MAG: AAA domain-containing protein [Promethearchaeota archaeon]